MSALACPTKKLRVELKGTARFGKPVGVVYPIGCVAPRL